MNQRMVWIFLVGIGLTLLSYQATPGQYPCNGCNSYVPVYPQVQPTTATNQIAVQNMASPVRFPSQQHYQHPITYRPVPNQQPIPVRLVGFTTSPVPYSWSNGVYASPAQYRHNVAYAPQFGYWSSEFPRQYAGNTIFGTSTVYGKDEPIRNVLRFFVP